MKIVAIASEDGWAVVEVDGELRMFRPPYSTYIILEPTDVSKAVHAYGFEFCEHEFDTLSEVIAFLKDEVIKGRGIKFPTDEQLKDTWKYASVDILLKTLGRIENEWIPQGKLEPAVRLATDIMEITKDEVVRVAANKVLEILKETK